MPNPDRRRKAKIQIITKSALIRLAFLFVTLTMLGLWGWSSMFQMPGPSYRGSLPPLTEKAIALKSALKQDLQKLSKPRNNVQYENLNAAREFLSTTLTQSGYSIKQQEYKIDGKSYYNIEAEKLGTQKPKEIVVIGGHYDSAFTSPGANDNGSGAAATLELAKAFANRSPKRTIRFVEFTNEEPPFFWTKDMGSLVYAKQVKQKNENIVAMLSLETMGYFSDAIDSQKYPFPLNLLYPSQGNFIAFIGNLNSSSLVKQSIDAFRQHSRFPSEGAALPSNWVREVGLSDQWSFWQQGYPGIMVTDTAHFRYPHYHTMDDTPKQIDFDRFTQVVTGLEDVVADLAE